MGRRVLGEDDYRGLACFKGTFSPDYENLAKYWEQKLEDGERPAVIDELCIDLTNSYACRQDHTKGWYNLTNMLAKKQKSLTHPFPLPIHHSLKSRNDLRFIVLFSFLFSFSHRDLRFGIFYASLIAKKS